MRFCLTKDLEQVLTWKQGGVSHWQNLQAWAEAPTGSNSLQVTSSPSHKYRFNVIHG